MREFVFQLNIINVASLRSSICNGYIVIVQLFVMIQWMWRKLMLFIWFFVLMACQPHVCMRMRNTKYCIVEVPSKRAFINLVLDLNVKQYPFLKRFIQQAH